jgi:hypothetical protein
MKILKLTLLGICGLALFPVSGVAVSSDSPAISMLAGCTVKPHAFEKFFGDKYQLSLISDLECEESPENVGELAFERSDPTVDRNPLGLYDVRFECSSVDTAAVFHGAHSFSEVFLRIGDFVYRPMLLAPMQSEELCGQMSGFGKQEVVSLCGFIVQASRGEFSCPEDF